MNKLNCLFRIIIAFIIGILAGFVIYPYIMPETPIEIPVLKIKEKTIKDTITAWEFRIIEIKDTLYKQKPFVWKLWKYEDSILKVQFETDTFRNFEYEVNFPETKIIYPLHPEHKKSGEILAGITFNNIHAGVSYKFLYFFVQYDFKKKNFFPGIGIRWQF